MWLEQKAHQNGRGIPYHAWFIQKRPFIKRHHGQTQAQDNKVMAFQQIIPKGAVAQL